MQSVFVYVSFGAEDMLAAIAHATKTRIGIAAERLHAVNLAGLPEHFFTTDMSSTHIRCRFTTGSSKWPPWNAVLHSFNLRDATAVISSFIFHIMRHVLCSSGMSPTDCGSCESLFTQHVLCQPIQCSLQFLTLCCIS